MAIEDYLDPEVGVAVAVSAVVFSPPVRRMARRGAVYGLAGIMMAGDALASLAGGIGRGVRQVAPAMAAGGANGAEPAAGAVSGCHLGAAGGVDEREAGNHAGDTGDRDARNTAASVGDREAGNPGACWYHSFVHGQGG